MVNAQRSGCLRSTLTLLGVENDVELPSGVTAGPWKIHLGDHEMPTFADLITAVRSARQFRRPVALAVIDAVGHIRGNRIEHTAVIPDETMAELARAGTAVVTQPGFLTDRGDTFLRDMDRRDRAGLYRYASLIRSGIPTAASSDAPYGPLDPWAVIRSAALRLDPSGMPVGPTERVAARIALDGYLNPAASPGGPIRRVHIGAAADLCLRDRSLAAALAEPNAVRGQGVFVDGQFHPAPDMRRRDISLGFCGV